MGLTPDSHAVAVPRWKWQLVWLMFLATMINYMDRQTLGSVSKFFIAEFELNADGLGETRFGRVEMAFGVTFATTQLIAGFLADRMSIRWLYAGALLLWSAAGFACGIVQTLWLFVACRVALAFGESFNWPCAVAAVRRIFPAESRSFANGIFHGGGSIGAIVTPLLVLMLVSDSGDGWRLVFLVTGGVGALWVIAWLLFLHGDRAVEVDTPPPPQLRDDGVGHETIWDVLKARKVWLAILVGLCVNVCWHFFRTWLPRICERDLALSTRQMQWVLAGYYVSADLGSMSAGYMTRRLARAGYTVAGARKTVMFGTASLCLLAIPAALLMTPWVTIPLFFMIGAGAMGGFPNYFNMSQDVSARHTAQVLGFTGAASWYAVALLHTIVGPLADKQGSFVVSLIVIGFVPMIGAIIGLGWPKESFGRSE